MATNITLKYSFLTDVWTSYDGSEQRRCIRQIPRRLVSYNYVAMDGLQAQWLRAQMRKKTSQFDFIPMWHDVAYLSEDFQGGKAIYIDPDYMYGFNRCDAIEIFVTDDSMHTSGLNVTKFVNAYVNNYIQMKSGLSRNLSKKNTYVLPLIRCTLQDVSDYSYVYSKGADVVLNFEDILYESYPKLPTKYTDLFDYNIEQFNRYSLPETYDGKDVLLNEPQWVDDNSNMLAIYKNYERLDNDTGIFEYDNKNTSSYDTHTVTLLLRTKKMITNFIKFIHKEKGRLKSFYYPTWADDFEIAQDISTGDGAIYVTLSSFYRYYSSNSRKKKIVIFTKDWKSYITEIASYSYQKINGTTYGKLLLASSFNYDIPMSNVKMISFFNLVRFDSDDFQIDYESNIVATTSIAMKEVDDS